MPHRLRLALATLAWAAIVGTTLLSRPAHAADWPTARHDLHRSNITEESLAFPLNLAWRYDAPQPPAPAWPESPRLPGRMDFDYAPAPVVAGGVVYLASCSDDTLRTFDAATGRPGWHFIAGGPIRFAPQVEGGRVYFAADDGYVYCLEAATGKPLWTFNTGPVDERFIGNGRMISRWPVRTGVLVVDGSAYAFGGIWPAEGIYGWSLDAATGKANWCFDRGDWVAGGAATGKWRPDDPHSGEFTTIGLTPQGMMARDGDILVVPMANNLPAMFNRRTGALQEWMGHSAGSDSLVVDGDMAYRLNYGKGPATIFGARIPSRGQANKVARFEGEEVPRFSPLARGGPDRVPARGKISFTVEQERLVARQAYALVLTKESMLLGQEGYVAAYPRPAGDAGSAAKAAEDRELWRAPVDGQAREMAVANGRLYISTDRGTLYCFAAVKPGSPEAAGQPVAPQVHRRPPGGELAATTARLSRAGVDRGYALVVGDSDASTAVSLAGLGLQVILATDDASTAKVLRENLLAENLNGRRVHVQVVDRLDPLPFASFFANAVIVAGQPASVKGPEAQQRFAREVYRVLRPCGGMLLAPGLPPAEALALLNAAGAERGEVRPASGEEQACIRRGPLPGARDWNSGDTPDQRVKWPLRPIWFGGPPTILTMFTGIGQVPPLCANGRYFLLGDDTLTAVDAYNGTVLWSRTAPNIHPHLRTIDGVQYPIANSPKNEYPQMMSVLRRTLGADADHVYLTLGSAYFAGQGEACVKLNARTGAQEAMYAPFAPGPVAGLDKPLASEISIDEKPQGQVKLESTAQGLRVTLTAADPVLTPLDAWDLFFDFRPPASRYGLHDAGVHRVTVFPSRDPARPSRWARLEAPGLRGNPGVPAGEPDQAGPAKDGSNRTHAIYLLTWEEIDKIVAELPAGESGKKQGRPTSLGFAAVLNSHDGGQGEPIRQGRLFCDAAAPGINNGWAHVEIAGAAGLPAVVAKPAVVLGPLSAMPTGWAPPGAGNPPSIDDALRLSPRVHPLTGELVPRIFRSGSGGCGRPAFSGSSTFGRTGKLAIGIYDFDDDSGLRFFGGIASNCGPGIKAMNMNAALGLLISSESRSHCDCVVPIRTTVVFAPAERRLNEDWAIFFDRNPDTRVRQAAINFGALGDRRDAEGTLWLSFPRAAGGEMFLPLETASRHAIVTGPPIAPTLQIPMTVTPVVPGRVAFRVNADRVPIANTDRPWIYGSYFRGIRKAELALNLLRPIASRSVDAKQAGDDGPQVTLAHTQTKVTLRHDEQNLYVVARRPVVVDRKGKVLAWSAKSKGRDAAVWQDDSLELFLSDAKGEKVVHLGLSASGATYDARSTGPEGEDAAWNGSWTGLAQMPEGGLSLEVTLPWATVAEAGLDRATLAVNLQMNQSDVSALAPDYPGAEGRDDPEKGPLSEPLASLGPRGRSRCTNFAPLGLGVLPSVPPRKYTVRLHFAELNETAPGVRVFDVKIQGQDALKDFDIAREAGGVRRALVKEFKGVVAGDSLVVEFVPHASGKFDANTTPIVSGMEVYEEGFKASGR